MDKNILERDTVGKIVIKLMSTRTFSSISNHFVTIQFYSEQIVEGSALAALDKSFAQKSLSKSAN